MGSRRTIDTSKMFRSMTGRDLPADEKLTQAEPAAEAISESIPAADKMYEQKKSVSAKKTVGKSDTKESLPEKAKKTNPEKKTRAPRTDDPRDRQSVKLGFYLTPRIYEAIKLHKAVNFIGSHNDSQIVNKALSEYLAKEIAALREVDKKGDCENRVLEAAALLIKK